MGKAHLEQEWVKYTYGILYNWNGGCVCVGGGGGVHLWHITEMGKVHLWHIV